MALDSEKLKWFYRVKSILESGGIVEFSPVGYSMWPTIRPGKDVVSLQKSDCYRRGDIVLAISDNPEGVFLHRVVGVRDGMYILMGDSNLYQQEICTEGRLVGKVVTICRNGRDVNGSATSWLLRGIYTLPVPVRRCFVRMINLLNSEI